MKNWRDENLSSVQEYFIDYDPVNRTLFPICPEDLEDTCLLEQLSSEQEICFVKDEIFPMESRKILVLKFKKISRRREQSESR